MNISTNRFHTPPQLMDITTASKYFGVSKYFLRQGIKNGTIAHTCIGNKYMIEVSAFQRQIDSGVYLHTTQNGM